MVDCVLSDSCLFAAPFSSDISSKLNIGVLTFPLVVNSLFSLYVLECLFQVECLVCAGLSSRLKSSAPLLYACCDSQSDTSSN